MSTAAEAFDQYAEEYDRWFESPEGRVLFRAEVNAVKVLVKDLRPPFLEVGVGPGRFAEALGIGYGIDPSPALLEKARRREIKVVQGEGERLPYEDEKFGGVFILFTLCFVDDPEKIFKESLRVLKPGGGLVVGMINRESTWGLLYSKKKADGHPLYTHARLHTPEEVGGMLSRAGVRVAAFSSTLLRSPSERPREEIVLNKLQKGAGFICMLARKSS
jgi:ubiquinone/menaquinone biosynthesis C-methylase UbiE